MYTLKQWYVIYTTANSESKVANTLSRRKIAHYCPLLKSAHPRLANQKLHTKPLFPSYIFVHIAETEAPAVKKIDGVLNFVYWLDKPAIINEEEIDTIRQFLNDYHHVTLEKTKVNVHQQVKIIHGPHFSREGNVLEVTNNTVKVSLPSLGYVLTSNVKRTHSEKIPVASFSRHRFGRFLQF